MLIKDKNGFVDIIIANNLDPKMFEVSESTRDNYSTFVIKHKNSPLEFWTRNSDESYFLYDCNYIPFSPNYAPFGYQPYQNWFDNISDVYNIFDNWLVHHVKSYIEELSAHDMWETFTRSGSSEFDWESINEDSTDKFNKEERELLIEKIEQFREKLIVKYTPDEVRLSQIDAKLNYLTAAIERLNKYDWKGLLISTLMGIVTTMSLDKSDGQSLVTLVKDFFSHSLLLLK